MVQRQPIKNHSQFFFCVLGDHLIDGRQVFLLRFAGRVHIHIKDQAFEQICLAIIPEMITLIISLRVGDDDIGKHLCHEGVPAQVEHTVPGVAKFRL